MGFLILPPPNAFVNFPYKNFRKFPIANYQTPRNRARNEGLTNTLSLIRGFLVLQLSISYFLAIIQRVTYYLNT